MVNFRSMKCGIALLYKIAFTGATKLNDGTKTSSCDLTPMTFRAICNAEVPLMVGITNLDFVI